MSVLSPSLFLMFSGITTCPLEDNFVVATFGLDYCTGTFL